MNMPLGPGLTLNRQSEREQMLEMLLSELDGMVYRCSIDKHWTMEFVSDGCHKLTGYQTEDLLGNARISYENITHPDDRSMVREQISRALARQQAFSIEYRIIQRDGSIRWVWDRGSVVVPLEDTQEPRLIHGFIEDITQRYLQQRALREAEERYRSIFENANEGIFQSTPEGHYLEINPALATIYGYDSPAAMREALTDIEHQLYVNPRRRQQFQELMRRDKVVNNFESEVYRSDGRIIWIAENAHVVRDAEGRILYYEGTVEDITERRHYQEKIAYQATHDELTGLPNRTLLADRINAAIGQADRNKSGFAVVFLDLDHFKGINDTLGHSVGDVLIRKIAERLQDTVRGVDTVARIGGDEFVLLLQDVKDNCEALSGVLERVINAIRKPCTLDGSDYTLGCSMGVCLYPADGADANILLKNADIAMYQAKEAGRNNFQFFTHEFNQIVLENHRIEQLLRLAIYEQAFEVHYQPIVDAASGALVKAEALLRWPQKDGSFISPARFIPIAENTGLIEQLGAWVLENVCRQLASWQSGDMAGIPVSINISPRQFNHPALADNIRQRLDSHRLDPALLELEITENCIIRDKVKFLQTLAELRSSGMRVAIDDFGSGYSNLDSLKSMHFSSLKIDRSFVTGVETEFNQRAICKALISMAHNLNLKVVAEGVETREQVDFLVASGCDLIQGYYFSQPCAAEQFEQYRPCP